MDEVPDAPGQCVDCKFQIIVFQDGVDDDVPGTACENAPEFRPVVLVASELFRDSPVRRTGSPVQFKYPVSSVLKKRRRDCFAEKTVAADNQYVGHTFLLLVLFLKIL